MFSIKDLLSDQKHNIEEYLKGKLLAFEEIHSYPLLWSMGQFMKYVLQFRAINAIRIKNAFGRMKFGSPIVG